jgi:hypothetical protein
MNNLRHQARSIRRSLDELVGSDMYSRTSQFGIEDRLASLFGNKRGTFIEAGANDGLAQSNTYWLENMRGWRGILIEAVPAMASITTLWRSSRHMMYCSKANKGRPQRLTARPVLRLRRRTSPTVSSSNEFGIGACCFPRARLGAGPSSLTLGPHQLYHLISFPNRRAGTFLRRNSCWVHRRRASVSSQPDLKPLPKSG